MWNELNLKEAFLLLCTAYCVNYQRVRTTWKYERDPLCVWERGRKSARVRVTFRQSQQPASAFEGESFSNCKIRFTLTRVFGCEWGRRFRNAYSQTEKVWGSCKIKAAVSASRPRDYPRWIGVLSTTTTTAVVNFWPAALSAVPLKNKTSLPYFLCGLFQSTFISNWRRIAPSLFREHEEITMVNLKQNKAGGFQGENLISGCYERKLNLPMVNKNIH